MSDSKSLEVQSLRCTDRGKFSYCENCISFHKLYTCKSCVKNHSFKAKSEEDILSEKYKHIYASIEKLGATMINTGKFLH